MIACSVASPVVRTSRWLPAKFRPEGGMTPTASAEPDVGDETPGKSKRGQQDPAVEPLVLTNSAVCSSPVSPISAMTVSVTSASQR
jgi:hypothetical protein